MSPEKEIIKNKIKEDHVKAREAQNPEKKDILRKKNKEDHRNYFDIGRQI